MSTPRQQHYLPEFYLRGFEQKGQLWVYQPNRERRRSTAEKEARQRDVYSFRDELEKLDTSFEHWLGHIESEVAPLIRTIEARRFVPSADAREAILWFVATMFTRVPAALRAGREVVAPATERLLRGAAGSLESFEALLRKNFSGFPLDMDFEDLRQEVLKPECFESHRTPEMDLLSMAEAARQGVEAMQGFRMQFVFPQGEDLWVLSDDPVLTFHEGGVGVGVTTPGVTLLIALSSRVALLMGNNVIAADADAPSHAVKGLNRFFIQCANFAIYSGESSSRLEKAAAKHIGTFRRGENVHIPMVDGSFA
jgi:hypothetical protein